MLSKINKLPITARVTLWYTFFIAILLGVLLAGSLYVFNVFSTNEISNNLIEDVEDIYSDISDFEEYDDGTYFVLYNTRENTYRGRVPRGFEINRNLNLDRVSNFNNFLYYDKEIGDGVYLRGIVPTSRLSSDMTRFALIIIVLTPIILLISAYGGYKILKNAFSKVENITNTAKDIKTQGDFSKRIENVRGNDEVSRMAGAFNDMLDTLETSYERERRFSSDVSHELRTPISVILSESQYGKTYSENLEESIQSLEVIENQSKKMKDLLNQIMDLSKLETTKNIEMKDFDFSRLIDNSILDYEKITNINISSNVEENIKLFGNKILISRLVDNLVSNAIKFTKDKILINLYKKDNKVIFEVADNGVGISKLEQQKIWDRFYQSDSSRNKENNKGYGLGLSFVKKICEIHNGKLEIESEPGKGCVFRVIF